MTERKEVRPKKKSLLLRTHRAFPKKEKKSSQLEIPWPGAGEAAGGGGESRGKKDEDEIPPPRRS